MQIFSALKLNLSSKLYLSFAFIGMVICLLVVFSKHFNANVRVQGEASASAFHVSSDVFLIGKDFSFLRREVERFVETGVDASRQSALSSRDMLTTRLIALKGKVALANERSFAEFTTAFTDYSSRVEPLFALHDLRSRLIAAELEPLANRIRETITGARARSSSNLDFEKAAALGLSQEQFLLARNNVTQYLVDLNPDRARLAERQIDLFRRNITASISSIKDADMLEVMSAVAKDADEFRNILRRLVTAANELGVMTRTELAGYADAASNAASTLSKRQQTIQQEATDASLASLDANDNTIMGLSLVALLSAALIAFMASTAISRPIAAMTNVMVRLSSHDSTAEIPYTSRQDEIGEMAKALHVFKENAGRVTLLEASRVEDEKRHHAARKASMLEFADNFQASAGMIVGIVAVSARELQSSATLLTRSADTTKDLAVTVTDASNQASVNVESVSASAEQMAHSVHEISTQMVRSTAIASDAVQQATLANTRIKALEEATRRIGDVVGLIRDIAAQTNLLALNATIEAARAGDAGRGFAVVAQEVKLLASQTEKATLDIADQVSAIQSGTGDAAQMVATVAQTISRMSEIATVIAAAIDEQQATTRHIAENSGEAAQGTGNVSQAMAKVRNSANDTGSAAAQVLASASQLTSESGRLSDEINRFIERIRAA